MSTNSIRHGQKLGVRKSGQIHASWTPSRPLHTQRWGGDEIPSRCVSAWIDSHGILRREYHPQQATTVTVSYRRKVESYRATSHLNVLVGVRMAHLGYVAPHTGCRPILTLRKGK